MNISPSTASPLRFPLRLGAWWRQQREARERPALQGRCPPATVAASQIPPDVRAAWESRGPQEFAGLRVDDAAWLRCSLALAQFFEACRLQRAQGPCALPSKGADSVWHVWLRVDPAGLTRWQLQFFDHDVPHQAADALGVPLDDCLARTWVGACHSEGLNPLGPRLPLVFALDGMLALPTGWAYRFDRAGLVHRNIDIAGRAVGSAVLHASVAATGLVGLGLLSEAEVLGLRRQQAGGDGSSGAVSASDGGNGACGVDGSCGGGGCGGGGT